MATLKLKRIKCADGKAGEQIAALRRQLSLQGNIVTPRGRALTEAVFGEALAPAQVVERICDDVRDRGLAAVLHYTEKFDGVRLTPADVRVSEQELEKAHAAADPDFLETIRHVRQNIMSFQFGLLHRDAAIAPHQVAGNRVVKVAPEFSEELPVLRPKTHPRCLTQCDQRGWAATHPFSILRDRCARATRFRRRR